MGRRPARVPAEHPVSGTFCFFAGSLWMPFEAYNDRPSASRQEHREAVARPGIRTGSIVLSTPLAGSKSLDNILELGAILICQRNVGNSLSLVLEISTRRLSAAGWSKIACAVRSPSASLYTVLCLCLIVVCIGIHILVARDTAYRQVTFLPNQFYCSRFRREREREREREMPS